MSNFTVKDAKYIRGVDPQNLFEKIIRTRIHDSLYWKDQCFGLTASGILEKAAELTSIGGCYGGNEKPTEFICLLLKMLQIQPEKDIVIEFIKQEDFKYARIPTFFTDA
ncbi:Pre-mRNA-splicing factor 38A, partial [Smittium culicis]